MKSIKNIKAPETTPVSGQNNEQNGCDPVLPQTATATAPLETLAECAEQAAQNHKLAVDSEASSVECGKKAIQFAIACGAALTAAKKQLKHGKWLPWLEGNVPAISEETAQRYMRLEKASHVTDLSECESLRQAYLACRILTKARKQDQPQGGTASGSSIPDVCVSLTETATPASNQSSEAVTQPTQDEGEKVECLNVGFGESEFVYELPVIEGEIRHPVSGSEADDLYEWVKPLGKWISRYEASKAESQSSVPIAELAALEPERMAA